MVIIYLQDLFYINPEAIKMLFSNELTKSEKYQFAIILHKKH